MAPPPASAWSDLGAGIQVRQSTVFWMNTVLLLHPQHAVLVDPGVLPSELDDIARAVSATRPGQTTLVFTHADWDHVLGRPWWPQASSVAHDHFAGELRRSRDSILDSARTATADAGERWERGFEPFRPRLRVSGLHFDRRGPWQLVYRDAFGHSGSMLSVHLPAQRLLIAGDMLSDIEIPILQQSCAVYRRTLMDLLPLAENGAIETVVPGHGSVGHGRQEVLERLRRDLGYLEELERGVRESLDSGLSLEETGTGLRAMDYTGKDADYSMVENHVKNIMREAGFRRPRQRSPQR